MALSATSVWECRTAGDNTNGGFYKSDAGTTDYSQQDTAQLSLTDLASDVAGTGISSLTGGFTSAMVGNGIRIESTGGFTASWYEITAYTDTNNITIDRSAGSSKTGGSGKVGGAVALPTDAMLELFTAGSKLWIKKGTYTLTNWVNVSKDGTSTNMNKIIGYNTTRGDNPRDDNRPLIAIGSWNFLFDNYWHLKNLRLTTISGSYVSRADTAGIFENIKATGSSGTTYGLYGIFSKVRFIDCEVSGATVGIFTAWGQVDSCYIHDNTTGISFNYSTGNNCITNNIIDTNTTGIDCTNSDYPFIKGNIVYNNTTGIKLAAHTDCEVINNEISSNGTGLSANTDWETNFINYNNWYSNTADTSNATKGDHATANDPGYTDAAGGDFTNTLGNNGLPIGTFQGGMETFQPQGALIQEAGAGGGGESSFVTIS